MLAKVSSPPINFHSNCLEFSCNYSHPLAFLLPHHRYRRNIRHGCIYVSRRSGGTSSCSRGRVLVRAGFTRTPLETAGAYQLIDDETGEKFIVWGGIDDSSDSPIPSKDILSWKPSRSAPDAATSVRSSGDDGVTTVKNDDSPTTNMRISAGSFGRLKAQRVKALVENASKRKLNIRKHDEKLVVENAPVAPSITSNTKVQSTREKKRVNPPRYSGSVSRVSQPQEFREEFGDTRQATGREDDTEHSDVIVKQVVEPISVHQFTADKPHKSDTIASKLEGSVTRSSAAHLRGWGNGRPTRNFRSDSADLNQHQKYSNDSSFFSRKSFRDIGCKEYMIESLKMQRFLRPSTIQAMVFSTVTEGKSCIIADQSGSGKTLAYLAPLVQRLRQEELEGLSKFTSQSPRAVIFVPTAELASQVLSNCRSMSRSGVPFKSMVVTGGFRQRTQLENLQQGVDVLIATPGRFIFLIKEGFLQLQNLRCAVLDEVDILFNDEDFEAALQTLINSSPVTTQYLFVTATLPVDVYNKLVEFFPDCEVNMGPGMHRTSPGLEEVLVDCSGEDGTEKTPDTAFSNKKTALLQLVEESQVPKTIVFCNKIETCRKVENVLKRFDRKGSRVRVLPFHAALAQESRIKNLEDFTKSHPEEDSLFLICTDRASRGIDFAGVDHVVLFDFPRDPSEYVRRVGRTARGAGGKGKAFIFVVGKQVSLARKIMDRNLKGHPLHDVPSSYELNY